MNMLINVQIDLLSQHNMQINMLISVQIAGFTGRIAESAQPADQVADRFH